MRVERESKRVTTNYLGCYCCSCGPELLEISCVGTGRPPRCCCSSCCCSCTPSMGMATGGGRTPRPARTAAACATDARLRWCVCCCCCCCSRSRSRCCCWCESRWNPVSGTFTMGISGGGARSPPAETLCSGSARLGGPAPAALPTPRPSPALPSRPFVPGTWTDLSAAVRCWPDLSSPACFSTR